MERGVPGDPPLGPWKISTNCFYMLVKLCTYLPLKCNISGQMDLIFWHSLHLHPAHFFIFQGCFSLRPSDHLIVLGFEPGVGPGTVPPQPCFFSACSLQYGYGSTPMIPIFDDFLG